MLYDFYDWIVKEHEERKRCPADLMEDGVGPHRADALNGYHHSKGVDKIKCPQISIPLSECGPTSDAKFQNERGFLGPRRS